jgi:creatinine amidohydrolase
MPTSPSSRYWADLTSAEFPRLDPAKTVAVLPVGATEQHGPHLPLRVDQALVDSMLAAALPQVPGEVPVLVLPTQAVGYSPEHERFPGTLTLPFATVVETWVEIGRCVAAAGVKKLLIFNGHGGQASLLDIVARELRTRANMIVYGCNWWNLPLGAEADALFSAEEHRFGVHAGEIETSLLLHIAPQRVDMKAARDFSSTSRERAAHYALLGNGKSAKLGWHMQDYNAEGAAGNAAAATAEKGRLVHDAAARQLALLLQELSALPLSTLVDRPAI